MQYLFYILAFLLSLGQLGRLSFLNQQINIYIFEIVLFIIVFLGLLKKDTYLNIKNNKHWALIKAIYIFLGVLGGTYLLSIFQFTHIQNEVALLYLLRLVLYFHFFILLLIRPMPSLRKSIYIFICSTLLFSILQYFLYPNLRNLSYLGWDPHYLRIFGFFFDSTTTGILLVVSFFYLMFDQLSNKKIKIGMLCALFLLILLTYSRITYISFLIVSIYFFIRKIAFWKIILGIALFFTLLFMLPRPFGESVRLERMFTIQARLIDNQRGMELWLKKPIIGYGYNHLRYIRDVSESTHAGGAFSSSYITILVASGIVGLLAFLYLLYRFYMYADMHGKVYVLIVGLGSVFDNVFLLNFILLFFFLVIVRPDKIKAQ